MTKLIDRIDRGWIALTLIAAIFAAGAGAAVDYYEVRQTVKNLEVSEAGREYFRLQAKIDKGIADQVDILEWCAAAAVIGAGCEIRKPPAASWRLFKRALAGGYSSVSPDEYKWFRYHHYQYQLWQKRTGGAGWFVYSQDRNTDRRIKQRYCSIGQQAWSERQWRLPRQFRGRPYVCPVARYMPP